MLPYVMFYCNCLFHSFGRCRGNKNIVKFSVNVALYYLQDMVLGVEPTPVEEVPPADYEVLATPPPEEEVLATPPPEEDVLVCKYITLGPEIALVLYGSNYTAICKLCCLFI